MKKISIIALLILVLTGCSSSAKELETTKKELAEAQKRLEELSEVLTCDIAGYIHDFYDYELTILEKLAINELYPYAVIASVNDVEHNTPLLFVLSEEMYHSLEIGDKEVFRVHLRITPKDDVEPYRFEFTIMDRD